MENDKSITCIVRRSNYPSLNLANTSSAHSNAQTAFTADKRKEEEEELRQTQTFQEVRPDPMNMLLPLRVLREEVLVSLKQSGLQGNNWTL